MAKGSKLTERLAKLPSSLKMELYKEQKDLINEELDQVADLVELLRTLASHAKSSDDINHLKYFIKTARETLTVAAMPENERNP